MYHIPPRYLTPGTLALVRGLCEYIRETLSDLLVVDLLVLAVVLLVLAVVV